MQQGREIGMKFPMWKYRSKDSNVISYAALNPYKMGMTYKEQQNTYCNDSVKVL